MVIKKFFGGDKVCFLERGIKIFKINYFIYSNSSNIKIILYIFSFR